MKKYAMRSLVWGVLGVLTVMTNVSAQAVDQIDNTIDCAALTYNLKLGSKDRNTNGDVTTLQTYLVQANYLDADPTGYFGNATKRAVKAFQSANGISPTGNIAAYSRAKIKELSCTGQTTSSSAPISQNTNTTINTNDTIGWYNGSANTLMPYRPGDAVKSTPSVGVRSDILRIDRPLDGYMRVVLPGNVNNNLASYWTVAVSCSTGVSVIDRSSVERCGSDLRDNQAVRYDGSVDRAFFEAKIVNNSGAAGNVVVSVREFDDKGNQIGGSKDGFTVAAVVSSAPHAPTILAFANKDPNPTTGATYIMWRTSGDATVSLDMVCTPGSISFTTDKGNSPICEKGGVWYWQGKSSDALFITPSGNTSQVTVPFTLTVSDPSGDYSKRQSQTINISFPATSGVQTSRPLVSSVVFDLSQASPVFQVTGSNLDSAVKLQYSANCCKATTGYLTPASGGGSSKQFYGDFYLLNGVVNDVQVRTVSADGSFGDWVTVKVIQRAVLRPSISSVVFDLSQTSPVFQVSGSNLNSAVKLEYSANCCKATTGYLTPSYGGDTSKQFLGDFYLLNGVVNDVQVRTVAADGAVGDWVTVKVVQRAVSTQPLVTSSFSYSQQYGAGVGDKMNSYFTFQISNWRSGLVLDVEPTVNCNDTYIAPQIRECNNYLFDISGKAIEQYLAVAGNPYVKGGASYRITGSGSQIQINGYVKPGYVTSPGVTLNPVPDNIDFTFNLRDLNQGGKIIWSKTERAQFKG